MPSGSRKDALGTALEGGSRQSRSLPSRPNGRVASRLPALALRAMTRDDLPAVLRWRRAPHVARWFVGSGPATAESIEARYGPRIDGEAPTRMWVVEVGGDPVGFVQDYRIRDYPDTAVLVPDRMRSELTTSSARWSGPGVVLAAKC